MSLFPVPNIIVNSQGIDWCLGDDYHLYYVQQDHLIVQIPNDNINNINDGNDSLVNTFINFVKYIFTPFNI